jgi:hypothetical protein
LGKKEIRGSQVGDACSGNTADKLPSRYRHGILPGTLQSDFRMLLLIA